ncbi:hypothetical protein C8R47DRAFT_1205759 [Mycena vitilis]|nr:hypothetical protein C8R47DRAFT_1205759 [Mycena vitilis]
MSSPYYCSLPLHGLSRNLTSKVETAQRVSEGVGRGGAVKYNNYDESLPAWRDCCDAGEHDHPANPNSSPSGPPTLAPSTPPTAPPAVAASPSTPRRCAPVGPSTSNVRLTPESRAPGHAAIYQPAPAAAPRYAISGTGIVYTDLNNAVEQFERVAASRPATFLTTEDSCYAAHFAAGHFEMEARALADGERLANEVEIRWDGGRPPSHHMCVEAASTSRQGSSSTQARPKPRAAKKVKSAATVHTSDDEDEDEAREKSPAARATPDLNDPNISAANKFFFERRRQRDEALKLNAAQKAREAAAEAIKVGPPKAVKKKGAKKSAPKPQKKTMPGSGSEYDGTD